MRDRVAVDYLLDLMGSDGLPDTAKQAVVVALGRIVGKRFDRRADPVGAVLAWFEKYPDGVVPPRPADPRVVFDRPVLPSDRAGKLTDTVGIIRADAEKVARWVGWLFTRNGNPFGVKRPRFGSFEEVVEYLEPGGVRDRIAFVPVGTEWCVLLRNSMAGTDPSGIPGMFANRFKVVGMRAANCGPSAERLEARILDIDGPFGPGGQMVFRSVIAMDDGDRWIFNLIGAPLPFEEVEQYRQRIKRKRFTEKMFYEYLEALGVPYDEEPVWSEAVVIEQRWLKLGRFIMRLRGVIA
jgi:hypothetical protein